MSQTHKITSYYPHSIPLNSFSNHKDFLRKRPSKVIQIKIAKTLESYTFPSLPRHSYSTKVLKLLKHVKAVEELSFDQHVLNKCKFSKTSMASLIKRARKVQKLTIHDVWTPPATFKTPLHLWTKYLCQLETMSFKLGGSMNLMRNGEKSLPNALKAFLKSLRRQKYMNSLKIQLPPRTSFTTPILLQSSKYPRSLQKFQLLSQGNQQQIEDVKLPCFSLSSFKKLETFALQITNDQTVIRHIVETVPSLSHLKSLNILLSHSFLTDSLDCSSLDSHIFSKLIHLSIEIPNEHTQTSLLERLNLSNLQSFHLSLFIGIPARCKEIATNLSKMIQLKALKLSINYFMEIGHLLELLFNSIAGMELLTSLRMILTPSSPLPSQRTQELIPDNTLSTLAKIFQKSIKLEDFSLECKYLIIFYEFSGLMNILNKSALNFKKFKLDTVPFALEPEYIGSFIKFIEGLENARTIELPCFEINSKKALTRMTSAIMKLKEIRSISLGKIGGKGIKENIFMESIERILGKRGLESFQCEITDDLKNRLRNTGSSLSFERVSKKNPFLKSVSVSLLKMMNMNPY